MSEALSWDERSDLAVAIVKQATEQRRVIPIRRLQKPVARAVDRLQAAEQRLSRDQAQASKEGRRKIQIFSDALTRMTNAAGKLPAHLSNVIGKPRSAKRDDKPAVTPEAIKRIISGEQKALHVEPESHFDQTWQTIEVWKGICKETLAQEDRRDARDDAEVRKAAVESAHRLMLDCNLTPTSVRDSVFCKLAAVLFG